MLDCKHLDTKVAQALTNPPPQNGVTTSRYTTSTDNARRR